MNIVIRQEQGSEYPVVNQLVLEAFKDMEFSDGDEHDLVANLRKSEDFIPELSLVALENDRIVGHILFTSSRIISEDSVFESLTLAPVSVHPDFQRQGIGKSLILEGLRIAKSLGFRNVNVLGHPDYYPKFGFIPSTAFGILPPIKVPEEVFMMLELGDNSLKGIHGTVQYAKEFGI